VWRSALGVPGAPLARIDHRGRDVGPFKLACHKTAGKSVEHVGWACKSHQSGNAVESPISRTCRMGLQ